MTSCTPSSLLPRGPEAITPTAHYTGYIWARHGLSPKGLATRQGRALHYALQPMMLLGCALRWPTVEGFLLARHHVLDNLLTAAIEQQRIGQVVEIAAGLSGRGLRFTRRYGDTLTYLEADLPAMAARKRQLLRKIGYTRPSHHVVDLDALRDSGPLSVAELVRTLDPSIGTAILTEGLLYYFNQQTVEGMWRRFAAALVGFSQGVYLADICLQPQTAVNIQRIGAALFRVIVRSRVYFHFTDPAAVRAALRRAGFAQAELHLPADVLTGDLVGNPGARFPYILAARVHNG